MSNKEYEITCDNTLLRQVYDNVRNQLYLCIETALNGVSDFIEYNIDGVMVMSQDLEIVMSNLEKMNLKFKITECRKVTNQEYTYSGSLRKFVNNNKLSQLV